MERRHKWQLPPIISLKHFLTSRKC